MDFLDRYEKHETVIQKRWQPFSIEVLEQNVLEGTSEIISILEKAKQSAKEIHDQEEKFTYLEFIEDKLLWNQAILNQNRSTKSQGPVQSNEKLNTGESKGQITGEPVEKIDWEAGLAELAYMFEILFKNEEIGCSMKQYKKRWALIAKHFTVKGEDITNKDLIAAFSGLKNSKTGKPRNHEMYEDLLPLTKKEAGFFPEE